MAKETQPGNRFTTADPLSHTMNILQFMPSKSPSHKSALLVAAVLGLNALLPSSAAAAQRELSRTVLLDKIRGAWAGQMIGVAHGAATEFRYNGRINEDPIKAEPLSNAIDQDDLYVEMTFARVMDTVGLDATSADYGAAFRDSQYMLWHANAGARRNLSRGIMPPWSGNPRYNIHADDIDFQIEADFIGIMCPGLPRVSNQFCDRVGRVMNSGDGLYGGMFVCGMYSAAYFENDPRHIVEAGLACLPAKSGYARILRDLLQCHAADQADWHKAWKTLQAKWDKDDPCPDGAFEPFNIDARLNGAYIAIGLLYGGGDFNRTMDIATRCGMDSDCNPSNAAGVMGTVLGFDRLPKPYRAAVERLADQKFAYTQYSFDDITRSSEARTLKVIARAGGTVTDSKVTIPLQTPKPPKLEQSNIGIPDRQVPLVDSAWRWEGAWKSAGGAKVAHGAGAEAVLSFTGSGVVLVGVLGQDGGQAQVFLDGDLQKLPADSWIPERTYDNDLWHITGLKPGHHTLRLVTSNTADARSKGQRTSITRAIIYRPAGRER